MYEQKLRKRRSVSCLFSRIFCCIVVFSTVCYGQSAAAGCPSFSSLIHNGACAVSDIEGNLVFGCNVDTPFIPASILKIPTALAALAILGPEYRFTTRFYIDRTRNLYIQGFGDPLLISEEISRVFIALRQRGVEQINSIFIDSSSFALEHQVPGREDSDNPFDAPVGAVVVNFNSVAVRVSGKRHIVSAEPQTPTLALTRELARNYLPGTYRLNICSHDCNPEQQMARYTIELFRALQKKAGIPGRGPSGIRKVPLDAVLVYEHRNSRNLEYLVSSFLRYSSNFIANLVYLACGAETFGYPATWAKADRAVHQELLRQLGPQTVSAIIQEDGAGLSRKNRITARAMLDVLRLFRPYADLLARRRGVLTKSGTMKKIFNYAGYLQDGSAYVILLNQATNTRRALLYRLKKKHRK